MVKLYVTPSCPYCVTLKSYLKEHDVAFEEIDVSQNDKLIDELIERTGQMGVPVLDINGELVVGFDKEKITNLLGIKE